MPSESASAQVTQNTSDRYLKRENLLILLETLFPHQTDFNIRVNNRAASLPGARLTWRQNRDGQFIFTAPREVTEVLSLFIPRIRRISADLLAI